MSTYVANLDDSDLSLLHHKSRSSKHKSLLLGNSIVDDSGADMEVADVDPSNDGGEHCPRFPVNSSTNGIPPTNRVRFELSMAVALMDNDMVHE